MPAPGAQSRSALALAAVLVLALAVRYLSYGRIFGPEGVLLAADGDTYYHALRAERIALDWPHVPWFDPGMNHPYGAEIPWPPLLDQLVATVAVATGPATPEHVAGVAALLPPLLGLAVVVLVAALGAALLGGSPWWEAALLVALLPAAVRQSFVGRPDHHVLEVLLSATAFLAYAVALRRERTGWALPALLGGTLALSFWNWSGSALYPLVLAVHVAALHLVAPAGDPAPARAASALARGGLVAALALVASVALLGPPGALASARLTPISGLSAAICAATAGGAALVGAARRLDAGAGGLRRAGHLALAALLPAALALVAPSGLRTGLAHGLTALSASSPWYATIREFWPLVLSGRQPWTTEVLLALFALGLTPLALPFAVRPFLRAWRASPEGRPALLFLLVWTALAIGLVLARRRFEGYAILPLAIGAAWAAREIAASLAPRLGTSRLARPTVTLALLLAVAAPGLPVTLTGSVAELPAGAADKVPLLGWLRGVPSAPGREGVLAAWSEGHEIQWLARKPVVSTPFGTDIDPRSLGDQAAFYAIRDPEAAASLLVRRRVGFVLLSNPVNEIATVAAFAPGAPAYAFEERDPVTGSRYALRPELFDLVVSRLWFFDGASRAGKAPGLAGYRLLAESRTPVEVLGHRAQAYKLFGVVEGALLRVRGARPGATVSATVAVETIADRGFLWTGRAVAGADGTAALRVPYASGTNGTSLASACRVEDGVRQRIVTLGEAQVAGGAATDLDLRG